MRRWLVALPIVSAAALLLTPVSAQQSAPAQAQKPGAGPALTMTGFWDYNDALSVDAASGRREQAPLSATQRPRRGNPSPTTGTGGSTSAGGAGSMTGGSASGPGAIGSGGGGSSDDFERSVMAMYVAERRALLRDLLEVPETLRITATAEGVTFVDDLQRSRTYPANGKFTKYQIGAAQFEARAAWEGAQFQKDIQAANKFRMSELYFLSDDGKRLFVVIRVGDDAKPDTVIGVNRVYDRIR